MSESLNASEQAERLPPEHPAGIRRLQVGCGPHHLRRDWWNTDLRKFPGIDEALDATLPWRWKNCLDYVYAEHFIEHLPIEGCLQFLAHAGNALRIGGRIRLSTPSLEWVMKSHFTFEPKDLPSRLAETFQINRAFHGWGHQFLYSREMIFELLKQVGFGYIEFFAYGQSNVPALRNLERHPSGPAVDGYPDVCIVEAVRSQKEISANPWATEWLRAGYTQWSHAEH